MASVRRTLGWLLLAVTVVLVVAGGWLALTEPAGVRMPDGSRLHVAGITWGKTHRIVAGSWWQRLLLRLWPAAGGFGGRAASLTTSADQLVVWVRKRGGPPISAGSYSSNNTGYMFDVVDEHGCSFHYDSAGDFPDLPRPPLFGPRPRPSLLGGPDGLLSVQPKAFPRRMSRCDLVLRPTFEGYPLVGEPEEARFRVEVPPAAHCIAVLGTPETFPIRRRVADAEFVVTNIGLVFPWWGTLIPGTPPPRRNDPRWSAPELRFHTRKDGRRTREWRPVRLAVSDGTGNRRVTDIFFTGEDGARAEFDGLCRREPAWKCELELLRVTNTRSRPDQRWKVRVPVPPAGQKRDLRLQYRRNGVAFNVEATSGAGKVTYRGGATSHYPRPTLQFQLGSASRMALIALTVTPAGRHQGARAIAIGSDGVEPAFTARPDSGWTEGVFELPVPAGTRWVDAEFSIYETRKITFLAKPPR